MNFEAEIAEDVANELLQSYPVSIMTKELCLSLLKIAFHSGAVYAADQILKRQIEILKDGHAPSA